MTTLAGIKVRVKLEDTHGVGSKQLKVSLVATDGSNKHIAYYAVSGLLQLAPNLWFVVEETLGKQVMAIQSFSPYRTPNLYAIYLEQPLTFQLSKGREYELRTIKPE